MATVVQTKLNQVFLNEYTLLPSQIASHYRTGKTTTYYEIGTAMAGFGYVGETREGKPVDYFDPQNGFSFVHQVLSYGMGCRVTERLFKSDQWGYFGPRIAKELAKSARFTQEHLAARPFNNAHTTFLTPDGQPFFSTGHLLAGGGTLGNKPSTAAALSQAAIQAGITSMRRQTDDNGKLLALAPSDLVVPPDLQFAAEVILGTQQVQGSNNNDINPVYRKLTPVIWDYLTSATAWFLRAPMPMVADAVVLKMFKPITTDSDYDWDTKTTKYRVEFEQQIGATDWRGYYGTPGA